jgi:hypothetical protein
MCFDERLKKQRVAQWTVAAVAMMARPYDASVFIKRKKRLFSLLYRI